MQAGEWVAIQHRNKSFPCFISCAKASQVKYTLRCSFQSLISIRNNTKVSFYLALRARSIPDNSASSPAKHSRFATKLTFSIVGDKLGISSSMWSGRPPEENALACWVTSLTDLTAPFAIVLFCIVMIALAACLTVFCWIAAWVVVVRPSLLRIYLLYCLKNIL